MKSFELARPSSVAQARELLAERQGAVLKAGFDPRERENEWIAHGPAKHPRDALLALDVVVRISAHRPGPVARIRG